MERASPLTGDCVFAYIAFQSIAEPVSCNTEIVFYLETQPELRRCTKIAPETKGCICANPAFPMDYLIDAARRNTYYKSQFGLTNAHGLQELPKQNFTRMNGFNCFLFHVLNPS
jgi:hypothetical protein